VKILVCVKRVPDTSARIKVGGDGRSVELTGVEHVVAPYDEFAIEDALTVGESQEGSEIVAVTVGSKESEAQLRTCLALGAQKAILVDDPAIAGSDSLGIARVLAKVVEREAADLVYCGKQATDGDFHAVGAQLATLLDRPFVSGTYPVSLSGTTVTCERPIEGGSELLSVTLPAVFAAEKAKGKEPRYANLKGIMMAKKKPIETLSLADLGVDASQVGAGASGLDLQAIAPPPARGEGQILADMESGEAVDKLFTLLREDAKAI
jgi:electron transfer flavoprotein beta subunit